MTTELQQALEGVDTQMNTVIANMLAMPGNSPPVVSMADNVTRPLYKELVKAHDAGTDVGLMEDAILSMMASGLLDFMLRVHGNAGLVPAMQHLQLIVNELAHIITAEITTRFTDGPAANESVDVH